MKPTSGEVITTHPALWLKTLKKILGLFRFSVMSSQKRYTANCFMRYYKIDIAGFVEIKTMQLELWKERNGIEV